MTAKDLIASIQLEKKQAVEAGILREEKSLGAVTDNEAPYKLPKDWEWCHLGDYAMKVTDYVASGSFASLKENVLITNDENYAVMVKTADFSNGFTKNLTYTDKHGYDFLENSNLFGGELILSNIGSIGKVFIVPDLGRPMTLASNTIMVRMTHSEYNRYMYYIFVSPYGQKLLKSISSGTSMLKFNKTQLKATVIPVAPLEEQNKICNTLDQLQSIISKREEELKKLDELIKARFVEMFGDVKANEFNWKKCTFRDVAKKITDGEHGTVPRVDSDSGYLYFMARNITKDGVVDLSETSYVPQEVHDKIYKRCNPEAGDLLLVCVGATIGKCTLVPSEMKEFSMARSVALIKPDYKKVNSFFLISLLRSDAIQRDIDSCSHAAAQAGLYTNMIADLDAFVPPLELQNQFAEFVEQIDKSKSAVQKSLEETQLLFDSLMQEFFS